jgi:xylulokinase
VTGLRYIDELFPRLQSGEVCTTGGGSRSRFWNGIKADVLGLPYRRLGIRQFAFRGSALIAGFGLGIFGDLEPAARRDDDPAEEEVYHPDGERHTQ